MPVMRNRSVVAALLVLATAGWAGRAFAQQDAYEPDNSTAAAKPLRLGTGWGQSRTLHATTDVDLMRFVTEPRGDVRLTLSQCTANMDVLAEILNSAGTVIVYSQVFSTTNCSGTGVEFQFNFSSGTGVGSGEGTYYIRVRSPTQETGTYRISLVLQNGPESADIRGRVVDPGGLPVGDVDVLVYQGVDFFWNADYTQPDGRFVIVLSPFGTYGRVRMQKSGYQPLDYIQDFNVPDGTSLNLPVGSSLPFVLVPIASTPALAALQAAPDSATALRGSVEASTNGAATSVRFEHRLAGSGAFTMDATTMLSQSPSPQPVVTMIGGLSCNTAYDVRAVASSSAGSVTVGPVQATTAACPPPLLSNLRTTSVGTSQVTAAVDATANGAPANATIFIRQGAQIAAQNTQPVAAGASGQTVQVSSSQLVCGTAYTIDATANNGQLASIGPAGFQTDPCLPGPPTVAAAVAAGVGQSSATLQASAETNGLPGTATFALRVGAGSFAGVGAVPLAASMAPQALSLLATSLACGTIHTLRVTAQTTSGTGEGSGAFTTAVCRPEVLGQGVANINRTTATVISTVRANAPGATGRIEYRIRNAPTFLATAAQALAPGMANQSLPANLTFLACDTDFDYRVVLTLGGIDTVGPTMQFRTSDCATFVFAHGFE
jgi:hypothetical protein